MPDYVVYLVGCPIIVYLLVLIFKKTRSLNQRIREHFEEEALGTKDPYADFLALAQVDEALNKQARSRAKSKAEPPTPDQQSEE